MENKEIVKKEERSHELVLYREPFAYIQSLWMKEFGGFPIPERIISTAGVFAVIALPLFTGFSVFSVSLSFILAVITFIIIDRTSDGKPLVKAKKTKKVIDTVQTEKIKKTMKRSVPSVKKLKSLLTVHSGLQVKGLPNCYDSLSLIDQEYSSLIDIVQNKKEKEVAQELEIEFDHVFSSLTTLAGEGYWGDIAKNPTRWDHPDKKFSEIRKQIRAIEEHIKTTIKRLNSDQEFNAKIAKTLIENTLEKTEGIL